MSVEVVLEKIRAHNSDVLGCIATHGERVYVDLPALYELVDSGAVVEHAENVFALSDDLETDHAAFNQLFLEYENHSVYARRLEDGVLLLLNQPMERQHFRKMQLGVNLFMKPLNRALQEDHPPAPEPTPDGAIRKTTRKRWF